MASYVFSLTPTFTQGLILGQLSILLLLAIILKYLFLDTQPAPPYEPLPYAVKPSDGERAALRNHAVPSEDEPGPKDFTTESAEWFNLLLQQVREPKRHLHHALLMHEAKTVETYRSKLRDDLPGSDGDEIARQRIERFANKLRPPNFVVSVLFISVTMVGDNHCMTRIPSESFPLISGHLLHKF